MCLLIAVFLIIKANPGLGLPKYSDLYPYLVDLKGWEASAPTGMNMSGPSGEIVNVERHYKKGEATLNVSILSGVGAYSAWTPFSMGITLDSPDTFMKTLSIEGYPAGVNHNKKEGSGVVVVLISAAETNSVALVIDYKGIPPEDALSIARQFPLKQIEGAFK
ncbi:MAG: hypothetical protein D6778_07910 [Nitrospirae bacterium]|nr:MAG: hypothetical protein D6778_07910 [Nitrospirota bacterium]